MSGDDRTPSDVVRQGGTSPSGSSDDRTPLMAIPEVRQLSDVLIENGYGDLVDKTEAFLDIDTAAMKVAALVGYGLPEQGSRPVGPATGTSVSGLSDLDPDTFIVRNAPNTLSLEQFGADVYRNAQAKTANRWEGPAYAAFDQYMWQLQRAVKLEGERLRTIGQALYEVAEAIERAQDDAELTFWGAVGLAMSGRGLGIALVTSSGVLAALAGWLVTAVSNGEAAAARASELANQETESELELRHPEYMERGPREHLQAYQYPKDAEDWRIDRDG